MPVFKPENLNLLETSESLQVCKWIAVSFGESANDFETESIALATVTSFAIKFKQ